MRFCFPLLATFALALAQGCGDEEPTIHDRVSDYTDEVNAQIAILCDCWQADGYDSYSDCTDAQGYLGPSRQACYEDALARDEAAARAWLDCFIDLEHEYTACLDERLECGDDESGSACLEDFQIGVDACVQLPENIMRGLESCGPNGGGGGGG